MRECCVLLNNFVLQDNVNGKWRWLLDPVNGYSVKVFYRYIEGEKNTRRGVELC